MSRAPERKYALTKLAAGDYLLPSNDTRTIWRFQRYTDGPSFGLEDWPRDREVWRILRWNRPGRPESVEDVDDYDRWDTYADGYPTRQIAINIAMRAGSHE